MNAKLVAVLYLLFAVCAMQLCFIAFTRVPFRTLWQNYGPASSKKLDPTTIKRLLERQIFEEETKDLDCVKGSTFKLARKLDCDMGKVDVKALLPANLTDSLDFRNVVLIVSFNTAQFEAIPKLYRLYNGLFRKIVFCIPRISDILSFRNGTYASLVGFSVIEYWQSQPLVPGDIFYNCLPIAYDKLEDVKQMVDSKDIDGMFHISDDVVPNLWNFRKREFNLTKCWMLAFPQYLYQVDMMATCAGVSSNDSEDCLHQEPWHILRDYQNKSRAFLQHASKHHPGFISTLSAVSKGERRIWNVNADVFYISRAHLFQAFALFNSAASFSYHMELAVGTIVKGMIGDMSQIQFISGQWLAGGYRDLKVTETYDARRLVYHPLKMATVEKGSSDRQCLFCALIVALDRLRAKYFFEKQLKV